MIGASSRQPFLFTNTGHFFLAGIFVEEMLVEYDAVAVVSTGLEMVAAYVGGVLGVVVGGGVAEDDARREGSLLSLKTVGKLVPRNLSLRTASSLENGGPSIKIILPFLESLPT